MATAKKNVCYCILDLLSNAYRDVLVIYTNRSGIKLYDRMKLKNYPESIESQIRKAYNLSASQKVTRIDRSPAREIKKSLEYEALKKMFRTKK